MDEDGYVFAACQDQMGRWGVIRQPAGYEWDGDGSDSNIEIVAEAPGMTHDMACAIAVDMALKAAGYNPGTDN